MNAEDKEKYWSFDNAGSEEQMVAVDAAMRLYSNSEDWISARAKEFPGLKEGVARPREIAKTM